MLITIPGSSSRSAGSLTTLEILWPYWDISESNDGSKTYSCTYRCPADNYEELKPKIGDPCPINSSAYAQSIHISYRTPRIVFIDATYSTVNLTYTFDRPVGTKEYDTDSVQSTATDSEGEEYPVNHNLFISRFYRRDWPLSDQYYASTITDKTNNAWYYIPSTGYSFPAYSLRIVKIISTRLAEYKYMIEIYVQYNPLLWNSNRYAPISFDNIFDPIG